MSRQLRHDLLGTLAENFKRHGDVVAYRVGPARGPRRARRIVVAVHHPKAVAQVLSDEQAFTRGAGPLRAVRELFGENLVTAEGNVWRRQRRTLQPLFTPRGAGEYAGVFEAQARRLVAGQAPAAGATIDVASLAERYTVEVLGHTLFCGPDGLDPLTASELARLVPTVGRTIRSRATRPVRLPLGWPTPANRRFVSTRGQLYDLVDRVLARTGNQRQPGRSDLLARLREAREPETGEPLSAQEIRDQALMFLFAAHTTTTSALTSTIYLLGRDPEMQEQVAKAAVGPAPSHGQDLVAAAVKEGLRLYPPSAVLARKADTDIEVGGRTITAGSDVLVSAWVTHRHPEFWTHPERFDPHRFTGTQTRPPGAYFPFGGGGRTCIGRHFAMLEATILIRELLRTYRLETLDPELPITHLASLRPSGPVAVRLKPRSEADL